LAYKADGGVDPKYRPELEEMWEEVVKVCKGAPLYRGSVQQTSPLHSVILLSNSLQHLLLIWCRLLLKSIMECRGEVCCTEPAVSASLQYSWLRCAGRAPHLWIAGQALSPHGCLFNTLQKKGLLRKADLEAVVKPKVAAKVIL
jgi:hypothetical protein